MLRWRAFSLFVTATLSLRRRCATMRLTTWAKIATVIVAGVTVAGIAAGIGIGAVIATVIVAVAVAAMTTGAAVAIGALIGIGIVIAGGDVIGMISPTKARMAATVTTGAGEIAADVTT